MVDKVHQTGSMPSSKSIKKNKISIFKRKIELYLPRWQAGRSRVGIILLLINNNKEKAVLILVALNI